MFNDFIGAPARFFSRQRRLRSYLVMLVVATLVPVLAIAIFTVWQAVGTYRQASINRLTDSARTLARSLESDLVSRATLLRTLSMASSAEHDDVQHLQYWLDSAAPGLGTLSIASTADFQARSDASAGSALPPADALRTIALESVRNGTPSLTNLYFAGAERAPKVSFGIVQTAIGGQPQVLLLTLSPNRLLQLAPQAGTTETSLLTAVVDGTGKIIARSRDSNKFVGRTVPDWEKMKKLPDGEHVFQAKTTEGSLVVFTFEELANTPGWVVVVGEPLDAFNARWHAPFWQIGLGGGLIMLLALLLSGRLARYILRPVRALAYDARAIVADDLAGTSTPRQTPQKVCQITEFESMRVSISAAQAALQRRASVERQNTQTIARSELRYRTLAHTGSLVLWRGDAQMRLTSAAGWEILTGEAEARALGRRWLWRVHPDDRRVLQTGLADGGQQLDIEFRVAASDGSWRWVRSRGSMVPATQQQNAEWVGVLEDVHERRQAQDRITYMALHDALTGLPNRTELRNRLETSIRRAGRGEISAVLYIDLDRFKEVNDTLGHPVGDALLRAVTQRLLLLAREVDTVARLGGDEFVFICSQLAMPVDAGVVAERIVDTLSAPYELNEHHVTIGASVGIMPISSSGDDADHLLKCADLALYRAKQEGRGRYYFFDQEMDAQMLARKKMERQLRRAIAREEMELSYQPVIDVRSRKLNGVEAAVHWNHPEQGPLFLKEFASLAEEIRLTAALCEWTLNRACMDLAAWPDCPKVMVDVSAAWIKHRDFLQIASQALQHSGLAPERLELAVDESSLLEDPQQIIAQLHQVSALGVRVAMDNFGSSYASMLGSLHRVPFGKVKFGPAIVRSIGQGAEWDAVRRAMSKLCGSLGIVIAADGVDDEAQLNPLSTEDCIEVQGGLFGGFMTAVDVLQMAETLPNKPTEEK